MKDTDFAEDIIKRHPATPQVVVKDIRAFLNGYTEEQIETIHGLYVSSPSSRFPPKGLSDFEELAKQNGITKKSEDVTLYWWKCDVCGTAFSIKSRGCPKCQSKRFSGRYGARFPSDIVFVKDGCYRCETYLSPKKPQGPSCHEYGKLDNGVVKKGYPPQPSMCQGCRCAVCCSQEYALGGKDRPADKERFLALQ